MQRTLDEQREEYKARRFLAMSLAGTVVWAVIGIGGIFLNPWQGSGFYLFGTGSILPGNTDIQIYR